MGTAFNAPTTRLPRSGDIPIYDAKLNQWVPSNVGDAVSIQSGLPSIPSPGDEFVYQAGTDVYWNLKWDRVNGYWAFIGGGSLYAVDNTTFTASLTNTYQSMFPTITVPFAGDYEVFASALVFQATTAALITLGPGVGGVPSRASQVAIAANSSGGITWWEPFVAVSAGQVAAPYMQTPDTTPAHTTCVNRRLWIKPIRVH